MSANLGRQPDGGLAARQVSPSNRGETSSLDLHLGLGVDRLSVAFEVRDFHSDRSAWRN